MIDRRGYKFEKTAEGFKSSNTKNWSPKAEQMMKEARELSAKQDADTVKMGKMMAQSDMLAPTELRQLPLDDFDPQPIPVGNGVKDDISAFNPGGQIDRLIHTARMKGDAEYAKKFATPQLDIKRLSDTPFNPEFVDAPVMKGDQFSGDDMKSYMSMMNTLSKTDYYNQQPLQDRPKGFTSKKRQSALDELRRGVRQAKMEEKISSPQDIRRLEDSPYPGDVVDAKLEPGEYVLNRNAVEAIGKKRLDKINNKIKPRFSDKIKSKARSIPRSIGLGARREDWQKYMQTGGNVVDLRGMEDELGFGEGDDIEIQDLRGQEDAMGFGENAYADNEEKGEKAIKDAVGYGKKLYSGAKDFLGKAYNRFGGDAIKASKAMDLQAGLNADMAGGIDGEAFEGQDELAESNLEMAKMMRDEFGLGKADYGMAAGQAGQQLIDDAQTGLGAGIKTAGNIYNKAQELYGKAGDAYQEFKPKAKKYLESDKFSEDASKGFGLASEAMHRLAELQGFDRPGAPVEEEMEQVGGEEEAPKEEVKDEITEEQQKAGEENYESAIEKAKRMQEQGLPLPDVLQRAIENQDNFIGPKRPVGGTTGMSKQEGGYIPMQGFIKQSLRNMYG